MLQICEMHLQNYKKRCEQLTKKNENIKNGKGECLRRFRHSHDRKRCVETMAQLEKGRVNLLIFTKLFLRNFDGETRVYRAEILRRRFNVAKGFTGIPSARKDKLDDTIFRRASLHAMATFCRRKILQATARY